MAKAGKSCGIALLGTGTVGGGVFDLLSANHDTILRRSGADLRIACACARNVKRARERLQGKVDVTADWQEAIAHPQCDIVVELLGGEETAKQVAMASVAAGKPLVTANKALLASHGEELLAAAVKANVPILFEAAVAGCIPVIRVLRHSLAGDNVKSILGIVNGTCNYILTRMRRTGMGFDDALKEASELGYAEADPTLDIDGWDAAHKAVIMSWLAYGTPLTMAGVPVSGVRDAQVVDEVYADIFGHVIKLVACLGKSDAGVETRVGMALVASDSKLAKIDDNLNAVMLDADACGEMLLEGAGAGGPPTAAAVVSDIIEAATGTASLPSPSNAMKLVDASSVRHECYLRLRVNDIQGVIAMISAELAAAGISIEAMHQEESTEDEPTDIAMLLHKAAWGEVEKVANKLGSRDEVIAKPVLLPIMVPHAKKEKS